MKSTAYKRGVVCGLCGELLKRSGHSCPPPVEEAVEIDALVDEIRDPRRANRAHVDQLKRRGRDGTHPTRRRRRG